VAIVSGGVLCVAGAAAVTAALPALWHYDNRTHAPADAAADAGESAGLASDLVVLESAIVDPVGVDPITGAAGCRRPADSVEHATGSPD
jgi:hypothetical protein